MSIFDAVKQGYTNLGNWADLAGTALNLPELNVSEFLASGPTVNTVHAAEPTISTGGGGAGYEDLTSPVAKTGTTTGTTTGTNPVVNTQQTQPVSFDSIYNSMYAGWDRTAAEADWKAKGSPSGSTSGGGVDPYAQVRNDINSGYNSYFANLDAQLGALPGQQTAQNQIIDNSYNQGVNDLNLQQTQGNQQFMGQRGEITSNQNKNLKGIDENLRNMFMAGNVYLGSKGAGDSSAANQYSYALTKQGNQARGDQMTAATKALSEVQGRETNLKNIVNNEMLRLKSTADSEKQKIGLWFQEAQQKVQDAIANGQLNKSQDLASLSKSILDQAITQLNQVQTTATDRQNSLITWAENNSTTINQLKTNIQNSLAIAPTLAGASNVNGQISSDAQGNARLNFTGYGDTTQKKDALGNIIS